ncbi:kinase-like protein [Gigaspora margarita]|nr:kinase-like protein [Gigaspora margarita]
MDDKTLKKFIKELKIFQKVDHPNIIKFYGVSKIQGGRLFWKNFMFVLQFAEGGSLRDHLKAKRQNNSYEISWNELIKIAKDIVLGLTYLHSKGIIHRDLHSNNILINDNKALIADFGISKQLDETSISSSGAIGMLPYIDPQCVRHNQKPVKESDIYSVGVLLWELTSGRPPSYNPIKTTSENVPSDYIVLYEECWSPERDKRPKLDNILVTLDKLSREITIESITSKDTINENYRISSNFPNESRSILGSDSSSYKTTISNLSSFFSNESYSSFSSSASTESNKTPSSNFLSVSF